MYLSKLKEITFIFENCESFTIPGNYIGDFTVTGIKKEISRIGINYIDEFDIVDFFAIEIHKDANEEYCAFDCLDYKHKKFDRIIEWNDITHIEFTIESFKDEECKESIEKKYSYSLIWAEDNDQFNKYQTAYISKLGNLYIVISDRQDVSDVFNEAWINDSEIMDFHFSMMDM